MSLVTLISRVLLVRVPTEGECCFRRRLGLLMSALCHGDLACVRVRLLLKYMYLHVCRIDVVYVNADDNYVK